MLPSRAFILRLSFYSLGVIAPLFIINYLRWTINADLMVYGVGMKAFSEQFWSGDIYPRWLMATNAGLGSPMFLFYSPLGFFVGAVLFGFIGPIDSTGIAQVFASFIPALFIAGITSYRWLSLHFPKAQAEKGALIYATFPFTIMCIYVTFPLAHVWALAWLPLALEGAFIIARRGYSGIWKLALGYALIALSHLPTTLVFAIIPCCYCFFMAPKEKRLKYGMMGASAALLGIMLAAIYLAPALANKPFVTSERFLSGQLVYYENFYHIRFFLGIFFVLFPLLGFFIDLPKSLKWTHTPEVRFWLMTIAALFFMTTELSLPIWHVLTPLHHLQFPFRFFSAMIPGAVFIAISWIPHVKSKEFYGFFLSASFIVMVYVAYSESFYRSDNNTRSYLQHRIMVAPEYRTPWIEKAGLFEARILPDDYINASLAEVVSGKGIVRLIAQTPRSIQLQADITSPSAFITLKRFYFPGWTGADISEHKGLLAVTLPRGKQDITLTLPWFVGEKLGLTISLIGLIVLLFLRFSAYKKVTHDQKIR